MSIDSLNNVRYIKISQTPNFKSSNVSLPEYPSDTVEISSKKQKEKEGMPKSLKWLLGIGGSGLALYGALVTHRALSRPALETIKKDLSETFRREVTDSEIKELLTKYKDILKIKDKKEFCQKAFDQIKNDYGYKDVDIQLTLNSTTDTIFGGLWMNTGEAFQVYYNKIIEMCGGKFNKQTKAQILDIIFHEFQHAKQTEYCMRTNPEKYFDALTSDKLITPRYIESNQKILANENLIKQYATLSGKTPEEMRKEFEQSLEILRTKGYKAIPDCVKQVESLMGPIKERLNSLFGKYERFMPGTKEYELGEQYIKNYGEYIEAVEGSENKEYLNQLIEKEARKAGASSYEIPSRTESIWNIFEPIKYKSVL